MNVIESPAPILASHSSTSEKAARTEEVQLAQVSQTVPADKCDRSAYMESTSGRLLNLLEVGSLGFPLLLLFPWELHWQSSSLVKTVCKACLSAYECSAGGPPAYFTIADSFDGQLLGAAHSLSTVQALKTQETVRLGGGESRESTSVEVKSVWLRLGGPARMIRSACVSARVIAAAEIDVVVRRG